MQENVKRTLKLGVSELSNAQIKIEIEDMQKYIKKYSFNALEMGYTQLLEEELDFRKNCLHEEISEGKWGTFCNSCGNKL